MRQKIVAGNWKMNKSWQDAIALASEVVNIFQDEIPASSQVKVVLNTPFLYLPAIKKLLPENKNIFVGAQNCHQKASGAFTGEISAEMLASIGVQYTIIGHSERREYFQENSALLAQKVDILLANNITPIFCCGEALDIREKGTHLEYVAQQLTEGVFHLSETDFQKIVIAYEPIWAIGTGKTASSAQAQEMHAHLRNHIAQKYGNQIAQNTSILYGGSCNPQNAKELFSQTDVDGGLIGGASLKSRDFIEIVKSF